MKILYYSPHPYLNLQSPSGYGTHMREMIAAMRGEGHVVQPLIMGGETLDSGPILAQGRGKRLIKHLIPKRFWETFKDSRLLRTDRQYLVQLEEEIRRFQPDLIYERANSLQLSGGIAAKKQGIPHVLEVNAPLAEERYALGGPSFHMRKAYSIEKEQLTQATRIAVVSETLRNHFVGKYGIPESRFVVTPNAIDPHKITHTPASQSVFRSEFGWGEDFVVGFVGSIFPWHGVDRLIRAFAFFLSSVPSAKLLIVGNGQILPDLQSLAGSLLPSGSFHFTGNVPHEAVFPLISAMNVAVLPNSHWYGSPVKLFEYAAMGIAIASIENGPIREVAQPNREVRFFSPEIPSMVEALQWIHAHPGEARAMASHFREKVLNQYTWAHNVRKVLTALPPR